jgi:hypothetical protein
LNEPVEGRGGRPSCLPGGQKEREEESVIGKRISSHAGDCVIPRSQKGTLSSDDEEDEI